MAEVNRRPNPKVPALRGKTVCSVFFEDSTRTRLSFETAAKRLSADTMTFAASQSSLNKGESLRDTIETIAAMGVDAFVVRHRSSGTPLLVSNWTTASVINAGDGWHAHPTQGLLDARRLSLLRDGATLVNTARGGLVDAAALEAELVSGRIAAVLDGGFTQYEPAEGTPSSERTVVRIGYDERRLYVAVRCFDSEPDKIRATLVRRDVVSDFDYFFVNLDSRHDHNTSYAFTLTPSGAYQDAALGTDGEYDFDPARVLQVGQRRLF